MLTWLCVCLCAWDMCRRSGNLKWIWWAIMVLTNRCLFGNMPKLWLVFPQGASDLGIKLFLKAIFLFPWELPIITLVCLFALFAYKFVCLFTALNYLDPFRYIINNSLCLHLKLLFLSFSFYQRKISWLKSKNYKPSIIPNFNMEYLVV